MISLDPVLKRLLDQARTAKASDIHLEPTPQGTQVRFRVGGKMTVGEPIAQGLKGSLVAKLKLMAGLDSTQRQLPQDGALRVGDVSGRLSTIPVLEGESVVIRLFDHANELEALGNLGMTAAQQKTVEALLANQWGLVILSGPTGSGKTTSFYAALRQIDPIAQKIITVEDPVEQHLRGVAQVPVGEQTTFARALRSILRHSPNVIGVGEIRDPESAAMAVQASLTGHLVVATLHADSVVGVVMRLRELGIGGRLLAEVLRGVSSQRLISYRLPDAGRRTRGFFEVSALGDELAHAIASEASADVLRAGLEAEGFVTLSAVGKAAVEAGELSPEGFLSEFAVD